VALGKGKAMELDLGMIAVLVPIVTALVQGIKRIAWIDARPGIVPFVAIAAGLAVAAMGVAGWGPAGLSLGREVAFVAVHGVVAGLAACGLYSVAGKPLFAAVGGLLKR